MAFGPGLILGGKYRLEREFARGGMGAIWQAHHTELEVAVAVKIINAELALSEVALGRFRQEARASAQLRSPHVVQILDYGVDDGAPYMVMELLKGTDLATLIETSGRLRIGRVLEIATGVCKALRIAHEANIVHRDLKPENIFIATVGGEEIVKVLDFGIAKALVGDTSLVTTNSSTLIGSPLYMSPEQSRGEPIDVRTDLWSLSVVLFEAITGAVPFDGKGLGDVFAKICAGETPSPSSHGIVVPGLDEFFKRALAKDREARFATALELLDAFADCADAAPLSVLHGAKTVLAAKSDVRRQEKLAGTQSAISSEIPKEPSKARRRIGLWFAGAAVVGGVAGLAFYASSEDKTAVSDAGSAGILSEPAQPRADHPGPNVDPEPAKPVAAPVPSLSASASSLESSSAPAPTSVGASRNLPPVRKSAAPVVSTTTTAKPTTKPTTDEFFGVSKD